MPKCFCSACRETFTCLSAFDRHRTGSFGDPIFAQSQSGKSRQVIGYTPCERRCMTEQEMRAKGMVKNDKGWWLTRASEVHWTEDEAANTHRGKPFTAINIVSSRKRRKLV